jgi:acyl-CoA dehydrogenase
MEALSGRFADVLSMLFMASASIKHFHDKGYPIELLPVVQWSNQWALHFAEQQLAEIIDNFPNVLLKHWLRLIIFPLGMRIKKPNDKLTLKIGELVQESKSLRETLAEGLFLTPHTNNPLTLLEEALAETRKIAPINKRINQAVKDGKISGYTYLEQVADASRKNVISKVEENNLYAAYEIIMKIINVDDFSAAELQKQK